MLALQGTLTVVPFHCISSSMDEHALGSGQASPSGSMEWRAQAPTPRQHPSAQAQFSPQRAHLAGTTPSGNLQIRAHPYRRPLSAHPAHRHDEHSRSSAASSPSSGFAQSHAYEHRQGIAPQPMRHSFTHPGGWQTALSAPGHGLQLGAPPELGHRVHPHISVRRHLKNA